MCQESNGNGFVEECMNCNLSVWRLLTQTFTIVSQASGQVEMAIFLVDMEFREKAKQLLTSKEIFAVIFFLVFAMVPWVEVRKSKS